MRDVPRHAENLPAELHRQPRGNQRAAVLRPLDDHDTQRHTRDDAIADRKIFRRGMRMQRKFADDRAALQHFVVEFSIFFRVPDIDPRAEHAERAPVRGQRPLVRNRVYASRHPAHNHDSSLRQVAAQPVRHLRAVKRRLARAHNAQARHVQDLRIAADVQEHRRIINLQQVSRILRFRPVDQPAALHLSQIC